MMGRFTGLCGPHTHEPLYYCAHPFNRVTLLISHESANRATFHRISRHSILLLCLSTLCLLLSSYSLHCDLFATWYITMLALTSVFTSSINCRDVTRQR